MSDVLQLVTDVRDVAVAALAEQMEASRRHEQQLKAQFSAQLRAERALWQTLNERQQVRARRGHYGSTIASQSVLRPMNDDILCLVYAARAVLCFWHM